MSEDRGSRQRPKRYVPVVAATSHITGTQGISPADLAVGGAVLARLDRSPSWVQNTTVPQEPGVIPDPSPGNAGAV
jgi:hypothetical protein